MRPNHVFQKKPQDRGEHEDRQMQMRVIRYEPGDEKHAPFIEVEGDFHDFPKHFEECNHRRYYSPSARLRTFMEKVIKTSERFDEWCDQSLENMMVAVFGGGLALYAAFGLYVKFFW